MATKNTATQATTAEPKPKKTKCEISKTEFLEHAQALEVTVNGVPMVAGVKDFSTGSFGWRVNEKFSTTINGKAVKVQFGGNLIIVNSKEAG